MAIGFGRFGLLAALLALGLSTAQAGDEGRVFELKHPAARCGDAFSVEQKTTFLLAKVGGEERGHMETRSSYKVKVVGKDGAKLVTRFELDPTTTQSDMKGKPETTTEPARTLEASLEASELQLLPAPSGVKANGAEALAALGSRDSVKVGETWTAGRFVPVAADFAVPVKATYTVASVEKDAHGHDLLKLVMKSEGSAELRGTGGIKLLVVGEGTALFDPERADRPLEVRLGYRFRTSGGEGADSETRTETTVSTHELASVASATSGSAQEKAR